MPSTPKPAALVGEWVTSPPTMVAPSWPHHHHQHHPPNRRPAGHRVRMEDALTSTIALQAPTRYPARPRASALPPLLSPPLSRPPFDPLYRRRPHAPVRSSYGRDPGVRGAPGNPPSRWRTTAEYKFFMEDALLSLLPSSRPATPSKCACNGPPRPTTLVFKPTTPLPSFFPPSLGEPVKGAPCALLDHKSSWRLSVFPLDLDTCTPVHIAPPCAQNRSPAWLAAASLTPGSPAPPY